MEWARSKLNTKKACRAAENCYTGTGERAARDTQKITHTPTNQANTNNGIEKNRHTLGKQKPKEKHNLTNNLEKQEWARKEKKTNHI